MTKSTTGSARPPRLTSFADAGWTSARAAAMVVTAVVVAGLLVLPDLTLRIAWFGIVPLLPASFLVSPQLWRNVCPIATANLLAAPLHGRTLHRRGLVAATSLGIVLLFILVPARRWLLNQDGIALALALLVIVTLAFVLGGRYRMKGGFCNGICPILPVEKLYGQSPLLRIRNTRCASCTLCTRPGCLDLDAARAAVGDHAGRSWIVTPFGAFAGAFPGLIIGYFQISDGPVSGWSGVYATCLGWAALSLVVVGGFIALFNLPGRTASMMCGGLAVGLYYWFTGPVIADAFGLPVSVGMGFRWSMLLLVGAWFVYGQFVQRKPVSARRDDPLGHAPQRVAGPAIVPSPRPGLARSGRSGT